MNFPNFANNSVLFSCFKLLGSHLVDSIRTTCIVTATWLGSRTGCAKGLAWASTLSVWARLT